MNNKILNFICFIVLYHTQLVFAELPKENELVVCQDQAELFGNGKGDDHISAKCIEQFKSMAVAKAVVKESLANKVKVYGYRNMLLVERMINGKTVTEIIAGNYTELHAVKALTLDEKNQEIAVLEESGDILFFTSKISGNLAPFRILKNRELAGADELVVDSDRNMVVVNNKKTKAILFFSRLANINGRKGTQKLNVVKAIDTSLMSLKNISIDLQKGELHAVDGNKTIAYDLKDLFKDKK